MIINWLYNLYLSRIMHQYSTWLWNCLCEQIRSMCNTYNKMSDFWTLQCATLPLSKCGIYSSWYVKGLWFHKQWIHITEKNKPFDCQTVNISQVIHTTTGQSLGPNQRGELCVKGPQVMMGYKDLPEQTAQTIDKDGWLHTGKRNINGNTLMKCPLANTEASGIYWSLQIEAA